MYNHDHKDRENRIVDEVDDPDAQIAAEFRSFISDLSNEYKVRDSSHSKINVKFRLWITSSEKNVESFKLSILSGFSNSSFSHDNFFEVRFESKPKVYVTDRATRSYVPPPADWPPEKKKKWNQIQAMLGRYPGNQGCHPDSRAQRACSVYLWGAGKPQAVICH